MNRKKACTHTWLMKSYKVHHSEVSKYNLNYGITINHTIKQYIKMSIFFFDNMDLYSKHMKVNEKLAIDFTGFEIRIFSCICT